MTDFHIPWLWHIRTILFSAFLQVLIAGLKKANTFWENNKDTEFAGFNGFYCSVENGTTVGFTLGYENAPYTYVLAPKYDKKANTDDRFFVIEAGTSAEFPLYVYCYKAACENDVSSALENCYYRYHRLPRKRSDIKMLCRI